MRQNYAGVFDFAQFDVKGVEPIKKAFEQAGLTVIDVEATNRAARRAGYQVKSATFHFADGQKVVMMLKNDGDGNGDIYQVKLNSRVVPVKNVDDMDKAVGEIATMAGANSASFLKAQRRKNAKQDVDESDLEGGRKKPVTAAAKLEAAQAESQELEQQVTELESRRDELARQLAERQQKMESDQAELEALITENEQLEGAA